MAKTVLESGQGTCAEEDLKPRILTECPPEGFCRFPGGELCVYAPDQVHSMTQMTPRWLEQQLGQTPSSPWLTSPVLTALGITLLIGLLMGYGLRLLLSESNPSGA